jgi:hypothetical protein
LEDLAMKFNLLEIDDEKIKSLESQKRQNYLKERIRFLQSERKLNFAIIFLLSLIFFINTAITLGFKEYSTFFAVLSLFIIILLGWYVFGYTRYSRTLKRAYQLYLDGQLEEGKNG